MKLAKTLPALGLMLAMSSAAHLSLAQTPALRPPTPLAATSPTAVPALIPYTGVALGSDGKPLAGEVAVTFLIFKDEQGGEPLFTETQTVALDSAGRYKSQLGATYTSGIPLDLFATGEARWLEVQIAGEQPQPRVLLVSVPYALKAADSATLGGLPPSAFVLAHSTSEAATVVSPAITPNVTSNVTTTGGTLGYVPEFSGASSVVDSPIFVNTSSNVGIGTASPAATLDVNGSAHFSGTLSAKGTATLEGGAVLPPGGTATSTAGFDSQYLKLEASAYNSSTSAAVEPRFQLQVEPKGNDTAAPNGTLNLLASSGTAGPSETGFYFNTNGTINFAPGQTFPGTGAGTITGVTAGTALTGGGTTGTVTLNLDTTKVPLLAASNTFTGNQAITGAETVSGSVSSASLFLPNTSSSTTGLVELGTTPFLSNYPSGSSNVFTGGAGNFSMTGSLNTATGFDSLRANTSGVANTADGTYSLISETSGTANTGIGYDSLYHVTSGSDNAGLGYGALFYNSTGSNNTAIGALAGPASGSTALNNTTAIGADATVGQNNTLVLGNTTSTPGAEFVNVGVGTGTPISSLEVSVNAPGAVGPVLTLTNPSPNTGGSNQYQTAAAVDFNTVPVATSGYLPGARVEAVDDGSGLDDLEFLTNNVGTLQRDMVIFNNGEVYIDSSEGASLTVTGAPAISYAVESFGSSSHDGFYGAGGDAGSTTTNGGNGGDFYGGNAYSGTGGYGIYAAPGFSNGTNGKAALLDGNVQVNGTLSADLKQFKIDDPIDPANKYLIHSSIESSEMVNIYSGNVTTDELGLATVKLPDWFEAANGDFRYQLTVVGGRFAQAIVSKEIHDHEFTISTNATNVKVSWQVTGVRQDAYAKAHPMAAEEAKDEHERGFYIHPELYGQPEEKQIEWGRRPEAMQRLKAQRDKAKLAQKSAASPTQRRQSVAPASAVNHKFATPAFMRP